MGAYEQIITLAKQKGIILAKDIAMLDIPTTYISRLTERGELQRIGRGIYMLPDHQVTENHSLAVVCAQVPSGVICLLSALRFHHLTTQLPFQVWVALKKQAWKPTIEDISMRYFWFSGLSYTEGIETHQVEGISINVYHPAKTVADCFKFRNRIGVDVAVEALRDGLHRQYFAVDELWHYAKICRVQSIITPYMEAIL
ncbi:MAG: type IV toxin-antitoxin system AbiEi family antitoxin domain-containing protein [Caldilineaceae bacterium]